MTDARRRPVTPPDGCIPFPEMEDIIADADLPFPVARTNSAPPSACTLCGCALDDPDPAVTCCDGCARQIAKAIVAWLDGHRTKEEKW